MGKINSDERCLVNQTVYNGHIQVMNMTLIMLYCRHTFDKFILCIVFFFARVSFRAHMSSDSVTEQIFTVKSKKFYSSGFRLLFYC